MSEGGQTITSQIDHNLLTAKKDYSIIHNDKILLSNRIIMLRKEEEKLMKKIKNTKEKATKILEIKQRNEDKFQERLEKQRMEEKARVKKREQIKKI